MRSRALWSSGDFAETWLPAALGQFKRTHPAVRVEVTVERNGVLLERLDRGELDLALVMGYESRPDAEHLATLPMTWIGPSGIDLHFMVGAPLDLALYNAPCFFRRAGVNALDSANIPWRLAYTTSSLQSLWAGVEAGLGITLRTAAGLPSTLRRLGAREGLPSLPSVELCLHAADVGTPSALAQLKRVVTETARSNLAS
ncbi:LysR substrate-binding domain-containing protein [Paraburkholderia sediminicola]